MGAHPGGQKLSNSRMVDSVDPTNTQVLVKLARYGG